MNIKVTSPSELENKKLSEIISDIEQKLKVESRDNEFSTSFDIYFHEECLSWELGNKIVSVYREAGWTVGLKSYNDDGEDMDYGYHRLTLEKPRKYD